jgi:hypothetical protein
MPGITDERFDESGKVGLKRFGIVNLERGRSGGHNTFLPAAFWQPTRVLQLACALLTNRLVTRN